MFFASQGIHKDPAQMFKMVNGKIVENNPWKKPKMTEEEYEAEELKKKSVRRLKSRLKSVDNDDLNAELSQQKQFESRIRMKVKS